MQKKYGVNGMSANPPSSLGNKTKDQLVFEFSIPTKSASGKRKVRNYRAIIQGINPNEKDRIEAMRAFVQAAIEEALLEMGEEAGKIAFTAVRQDGIYYKDANNKDANNKITGNKQALSSEKKWDIQKQDLLIKRYQDLTKQKSKEPTFHNYDEIWNNEILHVELEEYTDVKDQLLEQVAGIVLHAEELAANSELSQEEKEKAYQLYAVQCIQLYQTLNHLFPGALELKELNNLRQWLFFQEMQNAPNAVFSTWNQIEDYLFGAKEELLKAISKESLDLAEGFKRDLQALNSSLQQEFAINERIEHWKWQKAATSDLAEIERLEKILYEEEIAKAEIYKQRDSLEGLFTSRIPINKVAFWDLWIPAWVSWNAVVFCVNRKVPVSAMLRLMLLGNLNALFMLKHASRMRVKRELFGVRVHKKRGDAYDAYEACAILFIQAVPEEIEVEMRCQTLDKIRAHFSDLLSYSESKNKDALQEEIEKITSNPKLQKVIKEVLSKLEEVPDLRRLIFDLAVKVQTLLPGLDKLLNPLLISDKDRERTLLQFQALGAEFQKVLKTGLIDVCEEAASDLFVASLDLIAFCSMQLGGFARPVTTEEFFYHSSRYLDLITQGKWSAIGAKKEHLHRLSLVIANVKKADIYQEGASLKRTFEKKIQGLQEMQKVLIEGINFGKNPALQRFIKNLVWLECKHIEDTELKRLGITNSALGMEMQALFIELSPLQAKRQASI